MDEKKETIIKIVRIGFALVFSILALVLVNEEHFGQAGFVWNIILNVIAWIILGYDMVIELVESFIHREDILFENLLMVLASLGAFSLLFFGHNECFEAVMILLFFQIGELFEDYAHDKTKQAIEEASELRSKIAHRKNGESFEDIDPSLINKDDVLIVRVGEILPTDGVIIDGEGRVNVSSLTGESVPIHAGLGNEVAAGTILEGGLVTIRATSDYENNTVAKIIKLIESGESSKSKVHRFIDRFASFYTPIVFIISILVAVVPPLFLGISDVGVWSTWIYHGLCLLVISCPCSIVASIPLAYFAGMGLAGKKGILIKGAEVFDRLANMGIVYTDKTGTLTKGSFSVIEIKPSGLSEDDLIALAKLGEANSNHPIAKAILAYPGSNAPISVDSYEEIGGNGVHFVSGNDHYYLGKKAFLESNGIAVNDEIHAGSAVFLGKNRAYLGYIALGDEAKETSSSLVKYLHQMHMRIVVLSGDKKENVAILSDSLGLDGYEGDCTIVRKQEVIEEAKLAHPGKVAFMGDGINDAASLAAADLAVSMGKVGSDLATENSDIVLMTDNPASLATAHRIARSVRKQSIFNIILSLAIKLSVMVCSLVISGFPLIIAVASDTGLLVVCIALSVSLFLRKRL